MRLFQTMQYPTFIFLLGTRSCFSLSLSSEIVRANIVFLGSHSTYNPHRVQTSRAERSISTQAILIERAYMTAHDGHKREHVMSEN